MRSIAGAILVATSAFLFIFAQAMRGGADTIGGVVALGLLIYGLYIIAGDSEPTPPNNRSLP